MKPNWMLSLAAVGAALVAWSLVCQAAPRTAEPPKPADCDAGAKCSADKAKCGPADAKAKCCPDKGKACAANAGKGCSAVKGTNRSCSPVKHTRAPTARDSTCSAVGLSPSGSVAAASLDDALGTVTLWDTATGRQLARFPPPRPHPPSYFMAPAPLGFAPFMFSHDESTLAAVSQPAAITITLFNVAAFTSQARSQPRAHSPPEPKPATKPESGRKSALRTWTSAGGGFTLQAEFVKAIGGTVYLKRKDGEEVQVPIEKLSKKDQDFLRSR